MIPFGSLIFILPGAIKLNKTILIQYSIAPSFLYISHLFRRTE